MARFVARREWPKFGFTTENPSVGGDYIDLTPDLAEFRETDREVVLVLYGRRTVRNGWVVMEWEDLWRTVEVVLDTSSGSSISPRVTYTMVKAGPWATTPKESVSQ